MRLYVDARLPFGSGIGRYVKEVLPRMAQIRPEWQFTLGVGADTDRGSLSRIADQANIRIMPLKAAPFSLSEQRLRLRDVGGADMTWFTNYWIPYFWDGPFVVTVHDLLHLDTQLFPASRIKRTASRMIFRRLAGRAEGIIFVSDFTRTEFNRLIRPPKSGTVIHHGSDHLVSAGHFDKKKVALTVGALKQHKNLAMLLSAWQKAVVDETWKLVVVSPGDLRRSGISLPRNLSGVEFQVGISDAALEKLYGEASVFLFPSKYEGFGFPILEAALNDLEILASRIPAVAEVSRNMNICLIDPDDEAIWAEKIRGITQTAPRAENQHLAANKREAASYTWTRSVEETLAFLEASFEGR